MGEIEIFGASSARKTIHRKGMFLSVNTKNRNAYLSQDACKKIFGQDAKSGRLLVVHSKIEGNWYLAKAGSGPDLFNMKEGFECVANDPKNETSLFRINGAASTFRDMVKEMAGQVVEKAVFEIDDQAKRYETMDLYKVNLKK